MVSFFLSYSFNATLANHKLTSGLQRCLPSRWLSCRACRGGSEAFFGINCAGYCQQCSEQPPLHRRHCGFRVQGRLPSQPSGRDAARQDTGQLGDAENANHCAIRHSGSRGGRRCCEAEGERYPTKHWGYRFAFIQRQQRARVPRRVSRRAAHKPCIAALDSTKIIFDVISARCTRSLFNAGCPAAK
jgi:hypothetical protein